MGIDGMRVGGGRCSIVVAALLVICLMLICSWWTLSSENLELAQQIDVLNEQLKISTEERDQCIVLRGNLVEKYKRTEDEVGLLHIKLDQQNEIKKKNNELEESLTICKSQLDSMKKLDTARNFTLESYKVDKESLGAQLNAKQENINILQNELTMTKKELENLKLSFSAPSEKEREHLNLQPGNSDKVIKFQRLSGFDDLVTRLDNSNGQLDPVQNTVVNITVVGQKGLKFHGIPILPRDPPGALRQTPLFSVAMLKGANTEKGNDPIKQLENAAKDTNGMDEIERKGGEIKDNVIPGYEKEHKMKGIGTTNKVDGNDT